MRKFALLIALCLFLSMVAFPASANDQLELEQAIIDAMNTGEPVDVSRFDLNEKELFQTYSMLYQTGRLPWYADHSCQWKATEDGKIMEFMPKALSEWGFDEDLYEQKIAELINATCKPGMSDWQKALSVHDYIAVHVSYDTNMVKNSAYEALVDGSSACMGYAQLYMDVMRRIDIPCQLAECDDMGDGIGHSWNLIRLDGEWYHVDVTWDDATPDIYGRVLHTHFLRTDDQFDTKDNGHNFGWVAYEKAEGSKYSKDMLWEGVESAVCFGDQMYINRSKEGVNELIAVDMQTLNETSIYKGDQVVLNLGQGDVLYPTVGLSLWNDRLYFNAPDGVYSVALDGSDKREEFAFDTEGTKKFIYGSTVDAGKVYLTVSTHDFAMETLDSGIADAAYHEHSYSAGATVGATCASGGGTEWSCECGVTYLGDKTPALAHDLEAEEGAGKDGRTLYTCRSCGFSFEEAELQEQSGSGGGTVWLWIGIGVVVVIVIIIVASGKKRR